MKNKLTISITAIVLIILIGCDGKVEYKGDGEIKKIAVKSLGKDGYNISFPFFYIKKGVTNRYRVSLFPKSGKYYLFFYVEGINGDSYPKFEFIIYRNGDILKRLSSEKHKHIIQEVDGEQLGVYFSSLANGSNSRFQIDNVDDIWEFQINILDDVSVGEKLKGNIFIQIGGYK